MDELESIETSEEETINVETTTENNEEDEVAGTEEVTYEQAMKWKEDLRKASRKIAELKKQTPKKEASTDTELRFFFIENPEYKEHKEGILEVLSNPKYKDLTPDEALAIYKLKAPKESQTVIKNTIGGAYKPKPKTLGEMDEKEAVNLPPNEYIKYLKAKGELK